MSNRSRIQNWKQLGRSALNVVRQNHLVSSQGEMAQHELHGEFVMTAVTSMKDRFANLKRYTQSLNQVHVLFVVRILKNGFSIITMKLWSFEDTYASIAMLV